MCRLFYWVLYILLLVMSILIFYILPFAALYVIYSIYGFFFFLLLYPGCSLFLLIFLFFGTGRRLDLVRTCSTSIALYYIWGFYVSIQQQFALEDDIFWRYTVRENIKEIQGKKRVNKSNDRQTRKMASPTMYIRKQGGRMNRVK